MTAPSIRRAILIAGCAGLAAPFERTLHAQRSLGDTSVAERVVLGLGAAVSGGIATATVEGFRHGGVALIPVGAYFDAVEIKFTRDDVGAFAFVREPSKLGGLIDPVRGRIVRDGRVVATTAAEIIVVGDEVFLSTRVVGLLLDIVLEVDWPTLRVIARSDGDLPIQRRLARQSSRRIAAPVPRGERLVARNVEERRPLLDGFGIDYAVTVPFDSPMAASAYSVGVGLDLLGGALDASVSSGGRTTLHSAQASWTGVWPEQRWLSQARLGSGAMTGARGRPVRGVSFTNAPFVRPPGFGTITYGAQLAGGWEVETYRGGRLVAVDSTGASGAFARALPVAYGSNPVDFVAYGPRGEERHFSQLFQVFPQDFLPARRMEYGISTGVCETTECRFAANADVRVGVTSRVSVRGGLDWLGDDSLSTAVPYLGIASVPNNAFYLQSLVSGAGRASLLARWQPSNDRSLTIDATSTAAGRVAQLFTADPGGRQLNASYFHRTDRLGQDSYVTLDAGESVRVGAATRRARATVGVSAGRIAQLSPYLERSAISAAGTEASVMTRVGAMILLSPRLRLALLGHVFAYGNVEVASGAMTNGAVTLSTVGSSSMRLEAGVRWPSSGAPPVFTFRMLNDLPQLRNITTSTVTKGRRSGSQSLAGSIVIGPHGGYPAFVSGPSLRRARVAGRVYMDANVNGTFDAGDVPLSDVLVRGGAAYARTDSAGVYHLWDVVPFEPLAIAVDAGSLENPLWRAESQEVVLHPWPNRTQVLDVPITPGGVAEGTVLDGRSGASVPLAGARIALHGSGRTRILHATTFTDGSFSVLGVPPGRWTALIDTRDLVALGGVASALEFEVRAAENGDRVTGLVVTVGRKP